MTKEQVYKKQMQDLGIYDPIFDPEISTLCQVEREYTRAKKEWAKTAPPNGKPSVLNDCYAVVMKLRAEMLSHRQALGLTPQGLRKARGGAPAEPDQKDLITSKLDQIAARVSGYDGVPGMAQAAQFSDLLDEELRRAVHEDMG